MCKEASISIRMTAVVLIIVGHGAAFIAGCGHDDGQDPVDAEPAVDARVTPDGGDGGTPTADGATTCEGGLTLCGSQCVDPSTHPDHCGDCSTACGAGQACVAAQCRDGVNELVLSEVCALEPSFFELFNGTSGAVDLDGYQVQWETDGLTNGSLVLPPYSLEPQSFVVLREGTGQSEEGVISLGEPLSWAAGAAVRLLDPMGVGLDFLRTGTATTAAPAGTSWNGPNAVNPGATVDQSLVRNIHAADTDSAADWQLTQWSSPGTFCSGLTLCGATCVDVLVNSQSCGACGYVCGAGQLCRRGQCQPAVGSLWISEYRVYARAGVEVHNATAAVVDLAGYRIDLTGDDNFSYTFPSHILEPGVYAFVYMGNGQDVGSTFYGGPSAEFGPNVTIALFDASNQALDFVRFGNADAPPPAGTAWFGDNVLPSPGPYWGNGNTSYRRNTDTLDTDSAADWVSAMPSTPGFACYPGLNLCGGRCVSFEVSSEHCGACDSPCAAHESCVQGTCSAVGAVVLSELDKESPIGIELFNGTGAAVDLGGWNLRWDADGGSDSYTFGPGVTLEPGGFVRVISNYCVDDEHYLCLGAADAIEWTNHIAVTLTDAGDTAVDFVRTGSSNIQPPTGITWNGPNLPDPVNMGAEDGLHRRIYGSNSHSAADWTLGPQSLNRFCENLPYDGCDGICVNQLNDPSHCGACGNVCGPGGICSNGFCVREGDLALRPLHNSGQLWVFHDGSWRAGDGISSIAGDVACRQMGFGSGDIYGGYEGAIQAICNASCVGTEPRLLDCTYSICSPSSTVGLQCNP